MKELIFSVLRRNKKLHRLSLNVYDFVRPIFFYCASAVHLKHSFDRCLVNLLKEFKKKGISELRIIDGKPYFSFQHRLFQLIPFYQGDITSFVKDKKELITIEYLKEKMSGDFTFFDIGANIGLFTVLLSRKDSSSETHAFEPVSETHNILKDNVLVNELESCVKLNNVALSNKKHKVSITTNKQGRNHISEHRFRTEMVQGISLDEYINKNNIKRMSAIKCDVEGAELLVLKGAQKAIQKYKPTIVIEIQDIWTQRFGYSASDIFEFFEKLNYSYKLVLNNKIIARRTYTNVDKDITVSNNFIFEVKE